MKKHITAFVVLALTLTTTFANSNNNKNDVSKRVETSFKKEFSAAEQTSWSRVNDLYKAQFKMNGQVMFAFLNEEGQLVGVYRNILSTQLPIQLMTQVKEDYSDYWISSLFEMAKDSETSYYITLENGSHQLVLKSENSTNWSVYSRTKK